MVALLLRMRLAEVASGVRPGRAGRARAALRMVASVVVAAAVWYGILAVRSVDAVAAIITVGGAAVTVAVALAALTVPASGARDPGAFAPLGLPTRTVTVGTLLNRMIAPSGLILGTAAAACVVVWRAQRIPLAAGIAGAVLGAATWLAVGALCGSAARVMRMTPRARAAIRTAAVLVGAGVPVGMVLAAWTGHGTAAGIRIARVLARSPVGAAWALPARSVAGDPYTVVVAVSAAVVGLAAAVVVTAAGGHLRRTPGRRRRRRGWFAVTPATPAGAIAARSLHYWLADGRYVSGLCVVPVVAAFSTVPLLVAGVPPAVALLVPAPVAALFFGWLPHNDTAYDSTALWLHIAGGVRGWSDRLGRVVPSFVVGVPVVAAAIVVATIGPGTPVAAVPLSGACAGLLLSGLGLSSIASVVLPYPVTQPGDGYFRQPQRTGASGVLSQGIVLAATVAVCAPALWLAYVALGEGTAQSSRMALTVGIVTGVVVAVIGVWIGGLLFDRRYATLLERSESV